MSEVGNQMDGWKLDELEKKILESPEWTRMLEKTGLKQMTPVPIKINPKLNGRIIGRAWGTNYIDISERFFDREGRNTASPEVIRVMRHEMVHILCHQNALRIGHGKEFKHACGWLGLDKAACHEAVYRYVAKCTVCGKQQWKAETFCEATYMKAKSIGDGSHLMKCSHCGNVAVVIENVPVLQRTVAACMECSSETPKRYHAEDGRWVCAKCFKKIRKGPKPARIVLPKLVGPDGYKYLMQKVKRRPRMRIGKQSWNTKTKLVNGNPVNFHYDEFHGTYFYFQLPGDPTWWKTPIMCNIVKGYDGMEDLKDLTLWRPRESECPDCGEPMKRVYKQHGSDQMYAYWTCTCGFEELSLT